MSESLSESQISFGIQTPLKSRGGRSMPPCTAPNGATSRIATQKSRDCASPIVLVPPNGATVDLRTSVRCVTEGVTPAGRELAFRRDARP